MNTSLSPEFYTNLFNKIENYGFEPETEDDCYCHMEFEDFEGFHVSLDATFEVKFIDDSFDHAFGTEHGYHFEAGALTEISGVELTDEDGNDMSDLFNCDAFWEQFKRYTVKFIGGGVVNSYDTVLVEVCRGTWEERTFIYKDTQSGEYYCNPTDKSKYSLYRRSFKKIMPATDENRKRFGVQ